MSYLKITRISKPVFWIVMGRLIISPIIALLIIFLFGLSGITAQALFIASSFPTSRNSALLALEYNNYPEYASQAVLLTTILSSLTVAVVVYFSTVLFLEYKLTSQKLTDGIKLIFISIKGFES
ncbi:AEC family transporter [Jeotgalibacillus soli]|uniref:Uncharacterized protein n=1 Tax=Jeotgalibacillus soli TaxID=889306 RepID=A0A0C2VKS0_9BACL|nr:AEC family transporter [Jeotgalibacillus soli]KIL45026.1 hypothetical protein KP78_25700 [Jeotgalibacillus soli]